MASEVGVVKDLQEEVPKGKEVLSEIQEEVVNETAEVSEGKEVLSEQIQVEEVNHIAEASMEEAGESPPIREKMVLKSCDGQEFEVLSTVAMQSATIKHMIEDGVGDNIVPLPNVTGLVLAKVIDYWTAHATLDSSADELKTYDNEFVKMEHDEMFEMIMAANYLDTKPLLDLTCQTVADTIKDMTVEEVREYFGIENDFTPEEEARIRAENSWAFDD